MKKLLSVLVLSFAPSIALAPCGDTCFVGALGQSGVASNGAAQGFYGGTMFWSEATKQIYVMYRYYNRTNVWEVYQDTFVG